MSILKILQTVSSASGATKIAQDLLEKAVSKDAQDQILTFSTRAAYLQEKVLQVESALVQTQTRLQEVMKENEEIKKNSVVRSSAVEQEAAHLERLKATQKELNSLEIDYEELNLQSKDAWDKGFQEGLEAGIEKGREEANEDRDAQDK